MVTPLHLIHVLPQIPPAGVNSYLGDSAQHQPHGKYTEIVAVCNHCSWARPCSRRGKELRERILTSRRLSAA